MAKKIRSVESSRLRIVLSEQNIHFEFSLAKTEFRFSSIVLRFSLCSGELNWSGTVPVRNPRSSQPFCEHVCWSIGVSSATLRYWYAFLSPFQSRQLSGLNFTRYIENAKLMRAAGYYPLYHSDPSLLFTVSKFLYFP